MRRDCLQTPLTRRAFAPDWNATTTSATERIKLVTAPLVDALTESAGACSVPGWTSLDEHYLQLGERLSLRRDSARDSMHRALLTAACQLCTI